MKHEPGRQISRRGFLAAAAAPLVLPGGVLGRAGRPGANDRVTTGHIGLGTRGRALLRHLRGHAGAVCDVDREHLHAGAALAGPGVRLFDDYRRLLEVRELDAVVIATPDHWHGLQAIHACEAGKDVFLEVPAVCTPDEARLLVRAASWFARVVHTGSPVPRDLAPVPAGRAESLDRVEAWGPGNPAGPAPDPDAMPPEHLDWDRWLGPARFMPYDPARAHFGWRWVRALGGGYVRQRGAAAFEWALARLGSTSRRVTMHAESPPQQRVVWDCPARMEATFRFTGGAPVWRWRQPGETGGAEHGVRLGSGPDAPSFAGRGGTWEHDDAPGGDRGDPAPRLDAWLEAIGTREGDEGALQRACDAAVLGTLANVAAVRGTAVTVDLDTAEVLDDTQAARMLAFTGRGEHSL